MNYHLKIKRLMERIDSVKARLNGHEKTIKNLKVEFDVLILECGQVSRDAEAFETCLLTLGKIGVRVALESQNEPIGENEKLVELKDTRVGTDEKKPKRKKK